LGSNAALQPLLALQALGWVAMLHGLYEPQVPQHISAVTEGELFQPSLFQIDKENFVWILRWSISMIEDTKTLYKGAVFLFAEADQPPRAANLLRAGNYLKTLRITWVSAQQSEQKEAKGPTTLMSMEKMEDKLITFIEVCIGHCSAHAHARPATPTHTPTATPTSTATRPRPSRPTATLCFLGATHADLRALSSYELASSMSSKRSSSTCSYKGDTGEFRLGVLHDFKLIARKLLDFAPTRSTPAAA
jgi:hypothetical protein